MHDKTSWPGIAAGIAAGALWGLVFLAPELTHGFTSMQLSAGRYLAYGLVAALLIAPGWRRVSARLTRREWWTLAWLSPAGNVVYYIFLANAVRSGGVAMASLVIGLSPLAVTLLGNRDRHAVSLRSLMPSLLLGLAGLSCISWEALMQSGPGSLFGLLCAVGALAAWTLYAVCNSRVLARLHTVSAHEWSLLTGVMTGAQALLLALPAFAFAPGGHASADWLQFVGVVTGVAILCSVIGNGLWNVASRALPMSLMGQMIIFETVFAALYGWLYEARWPSALECAAMLLLVGGVVSCVSAHRNAARKDPSAGVENAVC